MKKDDDDDGDEDGDEDLQGREDAKGGGDEEGVERGMNATSSWAALGLKQAKSKPKRVKCKVAKNLKSWVEVGG